MNAITDVQFEEDVNIDDLMFPSSSLIIHNDDVNTFDWVIESLIDVCKHSVNQAEQCALLIHYKGKYAVKHASISTLKPMKDAIQERGINCTIE